MKNYLKVILTVIFVLAILLSLAGAFISASSLAFDINNIVNAIINNANNMNFDGALNLASSIIGVVMSLAFVVFFLLIAIGCVAGNIYVFVGGNTKKINELESIIDSAYKSNEKETNDQ